MGFEPPNGGFILLLRLFLPQSRNQKPLGQSAGVVGSQGSELYEYRGFETRLIHAPARDLL